MKNTLIFGAGPFAREIYATLLRLNYKVEAFIDKMPSKPIYNIPVHSVDYFSPAKHNIVLAVGSPIIKRKIIESLSSFSNFIEFPNIIDPKAALLLPESIYLNKGNVILANATLTVDISINSFNHFYSGVTITHDDEIGSFCQFSPGTNISGNNIILDDVYFGANSSTKENIKITSNTIIGAGATVISSISNPGTYIGTPAKPLRK